MTKSSLDDEPPPRFRGEKEVKKKNKNLPQLIFSTRNERNRDKSTTSMKNLEKQIKNSMKKYYLEENYSSFEKNILGENQTVTLKNLEFKSNPISSSGQPTQEFNYFEKKEDASARKKIKNIYSIDSSYSFTMNSLARESENKENPYSESKVPKENEEKDILYTLYVFEEQKNTDEKEIKFSVIAENQ
jgi:hypothetical protein